MNTEFDIPNPDHATISFKGNKIRIVITKIQSPGVILELGVSIDNPPQLEGTTNEAS